MKYPALLACLSFVIFCTGCSSKEQVYEHIYEGLKMRERMAQHPLDIASQEQISYDRYKKETKTDPEPEQPLPGELAQ